MDKNSVSIRIVFDWLIGRDDIPSPSRWDTKSCLSRTIGTVPGRSIHSVYPFYNTSVWSIIRYISFSSNLARLKVRTLSYKITQHKCLQEIPLRKTRREILFYMLSISSKLIVMKMLSREYITFNYYPSQILQFDIAAQ